MSMHVPQRPKWFKNSAHQSGRPVSAVFWKLCVPSSLKTSGFLRVKEAEGESLLGSKGSSVPSCVPLGGSRDSKSPQEMLPLCKAANGRERECMGTSFSYSLVGLLPRNEE